MRATDTRKTARQLPARQAPRKSGFGTEDIRSVMFEDINRGPETIDSGIASQFIHDTSTDRRRNPDY